MKYILLLTALFCQSSALAQIKQINDGDVSNFPEVIIEVNVKSIKDQTFSLSENSKSIDSITTEKIDSVDLAENRCVLFLWETLIHEKRRNMNILFKDLLSKSVRRYVDAEDEIAIATFGLKQDGTKYLDYIYQYGNDKTRMQEVISEHKIKRDLYHKSSSSALFNAITQAIIDMGEHDTELPKAIILLSAEKT